jgi:predicted Zn-dependent protease
MRIIVPLLALTVSACNIISPSAPAPAPAPAAAPVSGPAMTAEAAARQFVRVVETVEPVAEAECRARAPDLNCDFNIVVDDRPGQPPNAFQTVDKAGRPVLAFNIPLIATVRNADELAFVMGHEAAHHVSRHLARQQTNAAAGAIVLAGITALAGGGESAVQNAQDIGATIGARTYSKDFELEADELGTVIAFKAGYDPVLGAEFFTRIADPGNTFLGTHPPNATRIDTVRRTAATLQ